MPATLFVVATPIGNLEDLTFRALRILKEVDLIAAEDTRRTRGLLAHFGISKPLVSLREHNEHREGPRLVHRLVAGESVALVSDAGTPGISDPGAGLVRQAREAGVTIVPVPGPSSIVAALSVSGFEMDGFVFMGFPPASGLERQEWFRGAADERRAVVFLEAPHRIARTIRDVAEYVGTRQIFVAREITKKFESLAIYHTPTEAGAYVRQEGELTLILEPVSGSASGDLQSEAEDFALKLLGHIAKETWISDKQALDACAAASGVPANKVRKLAKLARYAAKQALNGS